MHSFDTLHLDITKVSLVSGTEHQKLLVLHKGHRKNVCGMQSTLLGIVFISA